jgi:Domain of unknown function (DUF4360)
MKKSLKVLAIKVLAISGAFLAATASQASAQKVEIVGADYGGNGCPGGSASVTVAPDGQSLSVLFDKYSANAKIQTESRKSCNLTIPIKVPNGLQVSLFDVDYRGYVAPNTSGALRAEYFFAGQRGPVVQQTFNGETNYEKRDTLGLLSNVWSQCNASPNLRINSSLVAKGSGTATLDSIDLSKRAGFVFYVKYRNCQ